MTYDALSSLSSNEIDSLLGLAARLQPGAAAGAPPPISRRARKKKREVQYLTEDELGQLFRAIASAGSVRDLALFEVAYHRGLRASEVALVQLGHLRLNQKRLYVTRLKGGISGEFVITDREAKALKAYLRKRPARPGPLFQSREKHGVGRRRLDQLMKLYGRAAGLPAEKLHFHCLRHSCGTMLLERDVAIELVQDHLGHTDIRNTMIYAQVTSGKRRRKDEALQGEW
jgi:type 1 fimbriae regulatory protein FimB